MNLARYIQRDIDLSLIVTATCTAIFGVCMIYSATNGPEGGGSRDLFIQQIVWGLCALVALVAVQLVPLKALHTGAYLLHAGVVLLLLILLEMHAGRWLRLGGVGLQPSEFAKLTTVLALARLLSTRGVTPDRPIYVAIASVMVLLPMGVVAKQPDLGTSLVFGAVLFPMLYWAGLRPLHLFFLLSPFLTVICAFHPVSLGAVTVLLVAVVYVSRPRLLAAVGLGISNLLVAVLAPYLWYHKLHGYQRMRILTFLNPEQDLHGSGYQLQQSIVAIGSGGFSGKGFMQGTQTKLAFLPAQHTDFVFAVVGEELGFIGAVLVLVLFFLMIWRAIRIAAAAKSKFASLLATGLASILVYHVFVNIGMTVGVMPVTGVPLPFLSYGGSSLVMNMMVVGLLLNVNAHRHEYWAA